MRGNVDIDRQSLRGFLHLVETEYPDELLRVQHPIDLRFDTTALVFELEQAGKSPVVVFENVRGNGMQLVTNVAGNRKLLAACLGVEPGDLPTAFRERCQKYIPCETVGRGAWDDVVIEGDDVDLTKLPIPLQFSVDAAPYITAGQIVGARPGDRRRHDGLPPPDDEGQEPAGRLVAFAPPPVRIPPPRRRAGRIAPRRRHPRHPSAALHGLDGLCLSAAGEKIRDHRRLFGEPYRLARCGVADLEVPAGAEIIIEGEILANVHEPEGPFGEFTGYASYRSTQNVFVAHRIRMRRDAMLHSVISGMSRDHILVSCITREGEILNALRRNLPNVRAVHVPHTTCGAFMAFISMKKIADGEPQMAIMATLGTELYTKYVIVVDDDVDIFNMNDVMWAIATRVRAEKDIIFIPGAKGAVLDPTSDPQTFTLTKMGIDATRPTGRDFAERLTISDDQRARARAILEAAGVKF